jgi:uncharacterized membrane protein
MRKELLVIGIVLIAVGVIFIPTSRLPEERKVQYLQTVASFEGRYFSSHIELYLEGNKKYNVLWVGTLTGYPIGSPTLEVKDPNGNIIYSSYSFPPPNNIDFWGVLSGMYAIDFNVLKSEDTHLTITKYVEIIETTYPYNSLISMGLLLIVLGAVVSIVGAVIRFKRTEETSPD